MAMLAAGLLCIASFSACSDDDDENKDKTYSYELVAELTDPGDLSQTNIQIFNSACAAMIAQVGTQRATPAKVKKIFNESLSGMKQTFESILAPMPHTKTVKITFGFYNTDTKKLEFSQVLQFN